MGPLEKYKSNATRDWLSDSGTYPIIVIMSCAMTFMTGMGIHALVGYKDVTLDPKKRNSILQTWGEKDEPSVLKRAIYWNSYQKICLKDLELIMTSGLNPKGKVIN